MAEELQTQGDAAPEMPSGESASGGPSVVEATETPQATAAAAPVPVQQQTQQQQPAAPSIRDQLAGFGLDVSQFQDDASALQAMAYGYRGYQQARPQLDFANQMLPYASQFQQWRQEQEAARRKAEAEKPPWHKVPEFDPRWRQQVVRDQQTGELRPGPGAPLDVVQNYLKYAQARQDFEDKFVADPIGALKPGLEEFMRPMVQEAIQQSLQQYQTSVYANDFVRQNSDWLHARDQQGNTVRDPNTGQPVLSPYGARFAEHLKHIENLGVRGVEAQQQLARERLELDLLRAQAANQKVQQGVQQQQKASGNAIQAGAQRVANRGGTVTEAATGSQNAKLRLRDRLRQAFNEQGLTDQDIVGPSVE